jgi:hypothetical protein
MAAGDFDVIMLWPDFDGAVATPLPLEIARRIVTGPEATLRACALLIDH